MNRLTHISWKHELKPEKILSRADYRELLLARMAAGDLYAAEDLQRIRTVDMIFEKLKKKPIYRKENK